MRILTILAAALAVLLAGALASVARAQEVAGDWIGQVTLPSGDKVHIAAHFDPAGARWTGTLASPDQSTTAIPMDQVTAGGDALAFQVNKIELKFAGKWDPAAKGWTGVLTQGAFDLPLTLTHGTPPPRPVVAGLDGHWTGTLEAPQGELHLVLDIKTGADGTLALFQSPDQSPARMVAALTRDGDAVTATLKGLGEFDGKLSSDGQSLDGTWKQGGGSLPLKLTKGG